jgi:hypothetical protein
MSHEGYKRHMCLSHVKPRHNFVYLSADLSQPYRFIVTPQICICGLSPGKGLNLPLCGVVGWLNWPRINKVELTPHWSKGNFDEGCAYIPHVSEIPAGGYGGRRAPPSAPLCGGSGLASRPAAKALLQP